MADRPKPRISVFQSAKTAGAICAEISIDDVMELQPDWTESQARAFLTHHGPVIGEIMLIAALQALERLTTNGESHA